MSEPRQGDSPRARADADSLGGCADPGLPGARADPGSPGDRADAGTQAWHRHLHHTQPDQLSQDTAQTPGMHRYEAISGVRNGSRRIWMGETHIGPGLVSGDHHHGEAETGIYVVRGHPVFVFLESGVERRIQAKPGDYMFVPPYVPHREENPSATEVAVVIIARSTQAGIVVNLPSLATEVPELDGLIAQLATETESATETENATETKNARNTTDAENT